MKKLFRYSPLKYLPFILIGLLVFTACDEDDANNQSRTKEFLATVK